MTATPSCRRRSVRWLFLRIGQTQRAIEVREEVTTARFLPLYIAAQALGRKLIEAHTMLPGIVQAECFGDLIAG